MKKKLILIMLAIASIGAVNAQVDNQALRFSSEATVDFKLIPELNNLSTYTVQFWFNPSVWTSGATIFTRDGGASLFAARLGTIGQLDFCVGNEVVPIADANFAVGKWAQVTISYDGTTLEAWVNNSSKALSAKGNYTLPSSQAYFKMGGNFNGRLDEVRLYSAKVDPDFHLWQNTLNQLHPNWNDLISYWKFDQFCENIADYKLTHNGERTVGVIREKVTDNALFKYRIMTAYTGFSRFFDRSFDRHKILLANDLLLLVCASTPEGTIKMEDPESSGTLTNCTYLPSYEGRNGVLSFNGSGAKMDVGVEAFTPSRVVTPYNDGSYAFSTWIYIDKWVKDAYLFRKEASDKIGFSVRLGDEATNELIAKVNGNEFKLAKKLAVGKWMHLSVGGVNNGMSGAKYVVQFAIDGVASWATTAPATKVDYKITKLNEVNALIGFNFEGKLDQTIIWHKGNVKPTAELMENGVPMPDFKKLLSEALPGDCNAYWNYDDPKRPGFDYYSHTGFRECLASPYKNHRGYMVRIAVKGHDTWQSDFGIESYRKKLAQSIADLTKMGYDGVELDHEWCYGSTSSPCNINYGKLLKDIREVFPADKIFTVSPHDVSHAFPKEYIQYADFYSFQNYGPNKDSFFKNAIEGRAESYQTAGYPREKIHISFSPMTSCPHDKNGARLAGSEIALWFFSDSYKDPSLDYWINGDGHYYWFTGVDQARWRAQYVVDNDLGGLMYWDIGADNKDTTDPLSVVRGASLALNSNADTIIVDAPIPSVLPEVLSPKTQLQVYLSSNKEQLTVVVPQGVELGSLELTDTSGRLVSRQKVSNTIDSRVSIPLNGLSSGVYLVRAIPLKDTFPLTQKFLIE